MGYYTMIEGKIKNNVQNADWHWIIIIQLCYMVLMFNRYNDV